jgi:NAD(P)-dependent dehydrogenase (short-subunit alcohol dehydrogenase family)
VASKGGLLGLTRAAASYLAEFDVNVNAVVPGITDTPRVRNSEATDAEHDAAMHKLASEGPLANAFGRVSKPEDVAEAIVFLCLPGSRQVTGQVLHTSAGAVV